MIVARKLTKIVNLLVLRKAANTACRNVQIIDDFRNAWSRHVYVRACVLRVASRVTIYACYACS